MFLDAAKFIFWDFSAESICKTTKSFYKHLKKFMWYPVYFQAI